MTLKESFDEWTDMDYAAHIFALHLGIIPQSGLDGFATKYKGLYWSNNPISKCLYDSLSAMATAGILLFNEDLMKYKWNKDFKIDN
jgi:hypothetical protein